METYVPVYKLTTMKPFLFYSFILLHFIFSCRDKVKPQITLLGNANDSAFIGEDYDDKRVSITDNSDNDAANTISITSNLNINKAGKYFIQYSANDVQGNKADPISRSIFIQHKNTYLQKNYNVTESRSGLPNVSYITTIYADAFDLTNTKITIDLSVRDSIKGVANLSGIFRENFTLNNVINPSAKANAIISDDAKLITIKCVNNIDTTTYSLLRIN